MKLFVLIVFIAVYVLMIALPKRRFLVALAGAAALVIRGAVAPSELLSVIDFNVLLMIVGMMITVFFFILSDMPMKMADFLLAHSKNMCVLTILLSVFAGLVSAFIDNVATVLMIAPVAMAVAKKQNVTPVPMIISIAVSSNLQGAATLVGDTTSILLGGYAKMNFLDFFFMNGRFGIFWAVELGALVTIPVMMILFRKDRAKVDASGSTTQVKDLFPTWMLLGTIVVLILASFLKNRPQMTNGVICMSFAVLCIIENLIRHRQDNSLRKALLEVDYQTLILLASLFVVVGALTNAGIVNDISRFFVRIGESSRFLLYTLIVWGSVLISAFIDNIPYVSAMLPVISGIAAISGSDPNLLYFGLLTGATLGGNITPFGASANITGIGILRKAGYEVKNSEFMRISVPFTLFAVTAGYLFLWFVWG